MAQFSLDRRSLLLGAAAIGALASLSACTGDQGRSPNGGGSATSDGSGPRTTLVVGATAEPDTLDIANNAKAAVPQLLLYNVLETLVKIDSEGTLKPLLASAWSLSDDRLTYSFTLRNNIRFSSGAEVTAEAVVQSLEHHRASAANAADLEVVEAVETPEPGVVQLTLSRPSNFLLYNLAGRAGTILDPESLSSIATEPKGSGAYTVGAWQRGSSIELPRNENYWGNQPKFGTVTFRYFPDPQALTSAMLAGDIDIISDVTAPESLPQFSDTETYTVIEGTTNGEVVLGFNHSSEPLKNLKVRQAINHAIDRQGLIDTVWAGKGTLIGSMVPPTDPWFEDLSQTYPYDPAVATQLLSESGVTNITLRLRVPALPYAPSAARVVASQLKEVGITVQVEELDFTTWIEQVYTQANYDMTIVAHVEPRDLVNWANPQYYWRYDNPEFQALVVEADEAPEAEMVDKLKQAGKVLADDAVADFLFLFPNLVVCKADLSGVNVNATTLSFDVTTIASRNG
ncbi:ABC transporter substrate-binding protein [Aestuariimicrobium ganziense]|uniref:ABC transporter substrate-binding protein n=1 Tax=Aestuariimicrobium ganziense TaxID=2773677 RepID=UPI00194159B8|nr:ABC transporter substrate-binding protein [Aestuariimicrobium ganziense]